MQFYSFYNDNNTILSKCAPPSVIFLFSQFGSTDLLGKNGYHYIGNASLF